MATQMIRTLLIPFCIIFVSLAYQQGCAKEEIKEPLFVPEDFAVPQSYEAEAIYLENLTTARAEQDYEAVMESRQDLRAQFGGEWPEDNFTLEQNKADLLEHEQLHQQRVSFTYTVLSKDKTTVLGCIYINPTDSAGFDAQVHMWVRTSMKARDLDNTLKEATQEWLSREWPFKQVIYW